jgi:AcrR family transcriptional regulator
LEETTKISEGRRDRKKREVRARIYQGARALFLDKGVDATRVEEIAAAADVSQATFFNYFPSKRAVLQEMARELMDRLYVLLDEVRRDGRTTQDKLRHYFSLSARGVRKRQLLTRDLLLEITHTSTDIGHGGPEIRRIHKAYAAILRDGQGRGEVRTDLDALFLAEMVFGAFAAVFTNWLNDPRYPIEARAEKAARFIGEAIAP